MRGLLGLLLLLGPLVAAEQPVVPYVDPTQLDVPWPKHSFYKQPWRGYLETRTGEQFLNGVGVNLKLRGRTPEHAVRLLAEAGVRAARIEIGWGSVRWDETGLNDEERWLRLLRACRQYGLRPTMLLNAHHGVPCPTRFWEVALAAEAPAGSRTIRLQRTDGIEPGRTGLCNLPGGAAAEALILKLDPATGEATLSKPLPKALPAKQVRLATLKYLPLYPVGRPEYDETAAGWVRYARLVIKVVKQAGLTDFDLEIWNELTFGSRFIDINYYHTPELVVDKAKFLHAGGRCWELGRRTIEAVKADDPSLRVIWGFSNTTFFHTPIEKLPPHLDGQSYHPYGTSPRRLPQQEDKPQENLDGYTPQMEFCLPEGWAHLFYKTESLTRLLNPVDRRRCPPGTTRFYHYLTEHGVLPRECGVTDPAAAWALKAKAVLRGYCFWLHKGVDVLHWYCSQDGAPINFGLLPESLPAEPDFERDATPPLRALRHLTRAFAGSRPLAPPAPLGVTLTAIGSQSKVFAGDDRHPPLWSRETVAVLPWQVDERKVIVAVYQMTYDVRVPSADEPYRLDLTGLPFTVREAHWLDPLTGHRQRLEAVRPGSYELLVGDTPRLLVLE